MYFRLNIGHEGIMRLSDATTSDLAGLLTLISQFAHFDDVVQVEIIEEITVLDGFGPQLARVGSFASYYNGPTHSELMERFHSTGRGLDIHNELNRLAQEQGRRTA